MMLTDRDCVVCGRRFETIDEHDRHYTLCAKLNLDKNYDEERHFDEVYNPKNY